MSIIERYYANRQLTWRDLFRRLPTPTALAVADLEQCQRERLHHTSEAEHHAAQRDMLTKREQRLRADIKRMAADRGPLPKGPQTGD
jgi:hypothetical protein